MELRDQVEIWRQKAAAGTLTEEEMREAIVALRAGRVSAASKESTKVAKAAAVVNLNFEDL